MIVVFVWRGIKDQLLYLVDIHFVGYVQGSFMFKEGTVPSVMASFWRFLIFSDSIFAILYSSFSDLQDDKGNVMEALYMACSHQDGLVATCLRKKMYSRVIYNLSSFLQFSLLFLVSFVLVIILGLKRQMI